MIEPWKRVEPTVVTKIDRRSVVLKTFQQPNDTTLHTFATFHPEGIEFGAVIALTPDNQVVVARQFRVGPERLFDELPGGGVEADEDLKEAVVRELREETGYVPEKIELLGHTSKDGYMNGSWHYFLATGCTLSVGGQALDEFELVEVNLISIDQLIENARTDQMTDPVAVLLAYDKLRAIQKGDN